MEQILEFCKSEYFTLGLLVMNIVLLIVFIANTISTNKTKKTYKTLIKKLGKTNNIEELLQEYLEKSEKIDENGKSIKVYCEKLDKEISKCIKKVSIIRYNAFKDVGSDLSFALALLDENNDGVVLNGLYSVENSNIYAKPVENGKSKYSLSEEEQRAIDDAIQKN